MHGIGMIRLGRENPPVDLLGGLQSAVLVVFDRYRQCFRYGCYGPFGTLRGSDD